jgi:hypothetical protein
VKKAAIALGLMMGLGPTVAGEESPTVQPCDSGVMAAATNMLRTSGAVRVRGVASTGRFQGYFTGVVCQELLFWSKEKSLGEAGRRFRWSDLKTLEVGRRGSAGWKGALIGVAIGTGLGTALRSEGDDATRSAIVGALVFGATGLTWPVTQWRPVELPKDALAR